MDAAIATMLCDGAQCPQCMGVGGGFMMSVYNATTKRVTAINAREVAPAAANATMFLEDPDNAVHGAYSYSYYNSKDDVFTRVRIYRTRSDTFETVLESFFPFCPSARGLTPTTCAYATCYTDYYVHDFDRSLEFIGLSVFTCPVLLISTIIKVFGADFSCKKKYIRLNSYFIKSLRVVTRK